MIYKLWIGFFVGLIALAVFNKTCRDIIEEERWVKVLFTYLFLAVFICFVIDTAYILISIVKG